MKASDFSLELGAFLGEHLPAQRNASAHTIASYSQTFVFLLEHFARLGLPATRLSLEHFSADAVVVFLRELEDTRRNGVATRNLRLAAPRSFSRYLLERVPERAAQWQRIIALRQKRGFPKQWIVHLDVSSMSRLLHTPDRTTPWGRRDAAMLSLLYDSGARVQELILMTSDKVRLEPPAHISVEGKGRKGRQIPLLPATSALLAAYMGEWPAACPEAPLFFNHQRGRMTRSGIRWIIRKYAGRAQTASTDGGRNVSPHTFRHSKAMHLLRSKASIMEMQSLRGHADVRTTMRYAHADEEMVRAALTKAGTVVEGGNEEAPAWRREPELLAWLKDLCRQTS